MDEAFAAAGRGFDPDEAEDAALRRHLGGLGYPIPDRPLNLPRPFTPLHRDRGPTDAGMNHAEDAADLADWEAGDPRCHDRDRATIN